MGAASAWGTRRYLTLLLVLSLHVVLVALLLMPSRTRLSMSAHSAPIEVMMLPPLVFPRVRAESAAPASVRPNVVVAEAPPELNAPFSTAPSALSEGRGSGINWTAEAHRAIRAYEIRRDMPLSAAMSVSTLADDWWPDRHRIGERFKIESGDWIVWITANCYEIASWHAGEPQQESPRAICLPDK